MRRRSARFKRRILRRLERTNGAGDTGPVLRASNIRYEIGGRNRAVGVGGIGAVHRMVRDLGLAEEIDRRLHLLKIHMPYHESDHMLSLAYNALCGGTCLEDLELRRNDEVFLDALGARRIPDPTTAGDFCRRFTVGHIEILHDVYNEVRLKVWQQQPESFLERATIDMDGTLVETNGECKQGMDISYDGKWGYHALVVSLAQTQEVLAVVNRPASRPGREGAHIQADRAIELCRRAGFKNILLRGDTDFSQTRHLDRWHDAGVQFIFGLDVTPGRHVAADDLPESAWNPLVRPSREATTAPRRRPDRVKERIVVERGFANLRTESEEIAETDYRPAACGRPYRLVAVRKNLTESRGQLVLFDDYRYFFYITNDRNSTAEEIVFSANRRCDQENIHAQLKGGVRCLHAPLDNLTSNWAYMTVSMLAWNLKAWCALLLPEAPGRWQEKHKEEKQKVVRMEFKSFVNGFIRLPCQIVRAAGKLVYRLLSWNPWQHVFLRMVERCGRIDRRPCPVLLC
jgi:hypothetical protein